MKKLHFSTMEFILQCYRKQGKKMYFATKVWNRFWNLGMEKGWNLGMEKGWNLIVVI